MAATGDATTGRPTVLPTRKVAGGGLAGTVATVVVWFYDSFGLPGAPVPPEVAALLTMLAGVAVAYATPPSAIETVVAAEPDASARNFYG
jgi:hypothetical protein